MSPTRRIKCLLVDDVPQNLTALEALLQRDDVEILSAQSGREALELLLVHSDVALALLDVQMPEMNGFELAELMRGSERTQHIPLIFLTAGSSDQDWHFRGYEIGAVDFLYKPIDPHMLLSKTNVFFELHHRKQLLAQELKERSEALRVNEMFMGVLSHDLRTPLMSIMAAAEVVKRQPEPEKLSSVADRLMRSSKRMASMVEDLLDVTRIRQAGGLSLHLSPCQMDVLVHRTLDEVELGTPGRTAEPGLMGDLAGVWDGERICQVLSNLVGNAVLHGDPVEPVRVVVDGTQPCRLNLTVTNRGTIAPDVLPHLFAPFRGGDRPAGRHQGLGLGLYIAYKIVELHGGEIGADSVDGVTCFRVQLPRVAAASAVSAR